MPLANSGNVRMGSYNDVAGNQWNYNITTIHNHFHRTLNSGNSEVKHLPTNPTIRTIPSPKEPPTPTPNARRHHPAYTQASKEIDSFVNEDGKLMSVAMRFMGIHTEDDVERLFNRLCGEDSGVVDDTASSEMDNQLELVPDLLSELYSQRSDPNRFETCLGEIFSLTGYRPSNAEGALAMLLTLLLYKPPPPPEASTNSSVFIVVFIAVFIDLPNLPSSSTLSITEKRED
ncbi:hypothetical protein ONZ45_g15665 [Pleurotus djamor]|nr:hypothetical protein ONZ45_g15665 [Pleurotus djamor]